LLLLFEENEEKVLNTVMSALDTLEEKIQLTVATKLVFQGIEIDVSSRMVYRDGKEIKTTFREFEILYLLASNPGRVFSKEQIYDIVWQEPYSGDYNIVMSHIRHIREKIEDNPAQPLYIQTVWGIGYRFNKSLSSSL
jgi:DNA-binding response OmpR family regulator